ncbi:MAG TPA: hypothetical protein VGK13_04550 [Methanocellaceae archaeon]|jgi:hypothetical protein
MLSKKIHRDNSIFLGILTLLGVAAIAEYVIGTTGPVFGITILMFVLVGIIAVLRILMTDRRIQNMQNEVPDERTKKIDTYAQSKSWYVTFMLICVFVFLNTFRIIDLSVYEVLIVLFFATSWSWIAFRWYYGRKGDVS